MKYEKSCGAICYAQQKDKLCVLMICHKYGGHWAFPKGHVEHGETEQQTAIREVHEETGAKIRLLDGYREIVTYSPARGVSKDVVFFVGEITGGVLQAQPEEVRTVALFPVEEAARRLTYPTDKILLEKARKTILSQKSD